MMTEESLFVRTQRKMVTARIHFLARLTRFQPAALSISPIMDEWSPLQIAYHLSIIDTLALEQMHTIQEEDNPYIENLAELAYHIATAGISSDPPSLTTVLATMTSKRTAMFRYLATLPDSAWDRTFQYEQWGRRKFYQFVNILHLFDKMSTSQLETQRLGKRE